MKDNVIYGVIPVLWAPIQAFTGLISFSFPNCFVAWVTANIYEQ